MISFTPWPLYSQGESPRYPLDRRLVGSRVNLNAVRKKGLLLLQARAPRFFGRPVGSLITIPTYISLLQPDFAVSHLRKSFLISSSGYRAITLRNLDSSVGIAAKLLDWTSEESSLDSRHGQEILSYPQPLCWFWDPARFPSSGSWG